MAISLYDFLNILQIIGGVLIIVLYFCKETKKRDILLVITLIIMGITYLIEIPMAIKMDRQYIFKMLYVIMCLIVCPVFSFFVGKDIYMEKPNSKKKSKI